MTAVLRLESLPFLSPLEGYDRAEWRRRQLSDRFRAKIVSYYRFQAVRPRVAATALADGAFRRCADDHAICEAYRDLVMSAGVRRVDPASPRFDEDLGEFHQNYRLNFPVPSDQESLDAFRGLLSAPDREDGYRELCYSVTCPLTGHYLIGANFVVQPESNSAFLVYGFANPAARGIGGFARCLVALVREKSRLAIAAHFNRHPDRRPSYHDPAGPLLLFEKNVIDDMSLPEILMDTAGIDIDRPPTAGTYPISWGIGQRTRDLVWHRCGARILDCHYFQPSLQGVVQVPDRERNSVIAYLNGASLAGRSRTRAENTLKKGLGGRNPGCGALSLCTLSYPEKQGLPVDQLRDAVASFHGGSVVKDRGRLGEDVYFQAHMKSLADHAAGNEIRLRPILPGGCGAEEFAQAEMQTRLLLRDVTWDELRAARRRPYRDWLAMMQGQEGSHHA